MNRWDRFQLVGPRLPGLRLTRAGAPWSPVLPVVPLGAPWSPVPPVVPLEPLSLSSPRSPWSCWLWAGAWSFQLGPGREVRGRSWVELGTRDI